MSLAEDFQCPNVSAPLEPFYTGRPSGVLFGIMFVALMVLAGVISYSFFILRIKYSPVKERPLWYLILNMLGFVMVMLVGPVREAVGRETYPCSIYILAHITWIPLLIYSQLAVTAQTYNKLRVQAEMISLEGFLPNLKDDDSMLERVTGERKLLRRLKFRASGTFSFILVAILCATIGSLLAAYSSRLRKWTSNCTGCELEDSDRNAFVGMAAAIIVIVLFLYYKAKKLQVFDSTRIMRESAFTCLVYFPLTAVYLPLSIVDASDAYKTYSFSYFNLIALASSICVVNNFLLPALRTMREATDFAELFTLADMLRGGEGEELFEKHLIREFSVENYKFWKDATKWKRAYQEPGVDSESVNGAVQRNARWIYDTYFSDSAIMNVTVSDRLFKSLQVKFRSDDAVLPADTFDDAVQEVYRLMEYDSFSRFLRHPRHKDFLMRFRDTYSPGTLASSKGGSKLPSLGAGSSSRRTANSRNESVSHDFP